ncbi:MAG: hypothetical protein CFK52_11875 [Chloracidobacterium sp. CP2_5A]|nr:MAG: hypothetical protein CFK52_11875 [Chloracidobacterium sp. CP2_5A]
MESAASRRDQRPSPASFTAQGEPGARACIENVLCTRPMPQQAKAVSASAARRTRSLLGRALQASRWGLLLGAAALAGGCAASSSASRPTATLSAARTVIDGSGRPIAVPAHPRRIVSQTVATDEILLAMISPERLAAVSSLADDPRYSYCADRAKLVAGRCGANAESILQLQPDLIFVASYSRAELVELLSASGAPVYRFTKFGGLNDIKSNIRALGEAVAEPAAAADLVADLERRFAALAERARHRRQRPRLMSFGASRFTAGKETTFDDLIRAIGGVNIAAEQGIVGFRQISPEQLAQWKPDYVITSAESGQEDAVRQRLLDDPSVAVAIGRDPQRIVVVESRALTTVSQHLADAAEHLEARLFRSTGKP